MNQIKAFVNHPTTRLFIALGALFGGIAAYLDFHHLVIFHVRKLAS